MKQKAESPILYVARYFLDTLYRYSDRLLVLLVIEIVLASLFHYQTAFRRSLLQPAPVSLGAVAVLLLTTLIATSYLLRYLNTGRSGLLTRSNESLARSIRDVERQVRLLRRSTPSDEPSGLSITEVEKLKTELRQELTNEISGRLRAEVEVDTYNKRCRDIFKMDEQRIRDQIEKLRYRSNVNLTVGVFTTVVAMLFLGWTVWGAADVISDTHKLVAYFVSRISTVVFVEVFSFFFLRLYRTTVNEEKFYQNEMTALSSRSVALELAFRIGKDESMNPLIQSLANLGTNGSLPSGEAQPPDTRLQDIADSAAKIIVSISKASAPHH